MRVVLLGPPGAGKGTQAQIIAGELGVPAISTGDIFRANVSGKTELGEKAKAYMDAGDLVPDEITVAMVSDRLAEPDAKAGFLLDGFPRTIAQAEQLRDSLVDLGQHLDCVLELVVEEDELVRRLSGRVVIVDGQPVQRGDDKPETVRHRLDVYREQTAPLSGWYRQEGLLATIDAIGEIGEVTGRALEALRGAAGSDDDGTAGQPARR
ncbi:adenylate kinase [Modestobacter sp. Leaf380]|uniref:adenylate kinase n=1 Tax=Modestobacter sp. Leaf380 TaxID=1736356 RepID=UPI0006F53C4B|nr:adenylate kinase [Modestobacter sp. Leaf380]KQS73524.1 adenylate kinase [Modestobacter sp. Leaf380]